MSLILRDYQQTLKYDIYDSWNAGYKNTMAVLATGGGKTAVMSSIFKDYESEPSVVVAHRQELVSQLSLALAKNGIYHNVVAAQPVVDFSIIQHIKHTGTNYHHENAPVMAAGVRTFINRAEKYAQFASQVKLAATDECHHVAPENQWWTVSKMFTGALGLGVTATPTRTDKKPLGAHQGGFYHNMVQGPPPAELMRQGFLSQYRVFIPPASFDRSQIPVSPTTGDLNEHATRKAAHKSKITGDVVEHYFKICPGAKGLVFTVDVKQAKEVADKFNTAGVPAIALDGKTPDKIRQKALDKLESGEIKVITNAQLFDEGFDCPSIDFISDARPTLSLGRYLQTWGRVLRPGKIAIYIDHVGNFNQPGFGPPDMNRMWSLNTDLVTRRDSDPHAIPYRACSNCAQAYEATTNVCPWCGHVEVPDSRSMPHFVDGDLIELDPEILAQMRGELTTLLTSDAKIPYGASVNVVNGINARHEKTQRIRRELGEAIDQWAGIQRYVYQRTDAQSYRAFYHMFGVDVVTAQTLDRKDMVVTLERIRNSY